jgi:hypothetical protein
MDGVNRRITWAAAVLTLALLPSSAQAQGLTLAAHNDHTGYVGLRMTAPPGATVTLTETTGGTPQPIAQVTGPQADVPHAARWRCTPRHRRFHAETTAADGTLLEADAATTTPRCRKRFTLTVRPSHPRAGRPLTVLLIDHWRVGGVHPRACARGPAGVKRCHTFALHEHRKRAAWRFRPRTPGSWHFQVRTPGAPRERDTAHVRPHSGTLRLLATGDSMIQIIDGFLDQRLPNTNVHSDARISTGISKPFMLDWPLHARAQARSIRPDATVVFIGANDGFPLHTRSGAKVSCCGKAWIDAYANRASGMMSSYARRGAGSVYWATLPAARSAGFRRVYRAVNAALRDAARRHPGEVRLVRLAKVFTPGFAFRQSIRWHGRLVSVRQADGVHLNVAGASIAATLIIRAMRRDGVI